MCINHDVVSDTKLCPPHLYTSDKNYIYYNNLWMYTCTCMYQQFISDDTSARSIIKCNIHVPAGTCILVANVLQFMYLQ